MTAAALAAPPVAPPRPAPAERAWELAQRALALGLLVALAPLFAALWVAVRATSPGPFLFSQTRRGLGGVPFTIRKVRTLAPGSERATALGIRSGDPTVTRVGRVLRDLKLDELPQLWNVVRGDMVLVGPRPIPTRLEDELLRAIPGFARRWAVKPGLTNVAQVTLLENGVGDALVDDWRRRFAAELHHQRHRSPAYDVVVLGLTALFVLRKLARRLPGRRAAARAA